jgi:hypothetical protein
MVFKVLLDPQDLEFKTLSQYLGITGSFYIIILCMWDEELRTFREKKKIQIIEKFYTPILENKK